MGRKYSTKTKSLFAKRKSRKGGLLKRRHMLETLKMKEETLAIVESTRIPEDINDESISCQDPVKLLSGLVDSKISIQGKLEMQFAVKRNEIINNHPYITVIADDSWAKRSYDKDSAYDSLSGAEAIVGTQKKFSLLAFATSFVRYAIWRNEKVSKQKIINALKISIVTLVLHAWKVMLLLKDSHVALQFME
ncbi:hypothetical protein G5I_08744 [Acromyrmex echinatior]|uniref:Uncharacterized protein n=1 Tax=Acromyrmex echinatior TaxID=103372 RepID=F4WSC2_ACREC|nr:hypothetical protein G5I_08744 [Acromyrmex echinatior]